MDEEKLRKLLEQLREEIDNSQNVDEKGKTLLKNTRADIDSYLRNREGHSSLAHPTITERLEEAIAHFEATHPALTSTLTELLNILSNAGI